MERVSKVHESACMAAVIIVRVSCEHYITQTSSRLVEAKPAPARSAHSTTGQSVRQ
jgi:hypothetical protein